MTAWGQKQPFTLPDVTATLSAELPFVRNEQSGGFGSGTDIMTPLNAVCLVPESRHDYPLILNFAVVLAGFLVR
jgi:hypothetical protein